MSERIISKKMMTYAVCLKTGRVVNNIHVEDEEYVELVNGNDFSNGGRDYQAVAERVPPDVFGFYFCEIVTTTVEVDGEIQERYGEPKGKTYPYYIDAEAYDIKDLYQVPGDHSAMIKDVRAAGCQFVIHCRSGYFKLYRGATQHFVTVRSER